MSLTFYLYSILVLLFMFKVNLISAIGSLYTSERNNTFYIDNEQKYNWVEALIKCREMNMSLLTIDTETKSNEINKLVKDTFGRKENLWVGGISSRYPTRHFIWLSTGKTFTYSYWEGKNPDFSGNNEFCVEIGWGSNMEWNDKDCNYPIGFVCEANPQHKEMEHLQKQLQQEIENKQKLQDIVLGRRTPEIMLHQDLESVKKELKQIEVDQKENWNKNLEELKKLTKPNLILHFHQDRFNRPN